MKLKAISKSLGYSISMIGILSALSNSGNAGTMGPVMVSEPGRIYVGVFGGGGESTRMHIAQYGTAYYTEANGGPLAVNAFGRAHGRSVGLIGGQVGYQWSEIVLNSFRSLSGLTPAVELEGYYLNKSTFGGHDINNDTTRLAEHDFIVRYPMEAGIFLSNAVLNVNLASLPRVHPYVAAGIGAGVLSIPHATATQVAPAEPGINHYNSNAHDTESTFAGQIKAGLTVDLSRHLGLFAEYRWLYLSSTNYAFGSTVYPGHPVTSNWLVKLDPQHYNLGAVGIRYSV